MMNDRRKFLKTLASMAALGSVNAAMAQSAARVPSGDQDEHDDRRYWISVLQRLAGPVLGHLANQELKKAMPIETLGDPAERSRYTHLEAFGRTLAGIAPWLGTQGLEGEEAILQGRLLSLRSFRLRRPPTRPLRIS
jgi:hypothetical protein